MVPALWHATPEAEVVAAFDAGPDGLTAAEAQARLTRFGPNRLPEAKAASAARLLLDQVRTPLMWALSAAGGLAPALGELEDGLVVLAVPVYLVQGRHEARGRAQLAEQWFRLLDAPKKRLIRFETSGHRPLFEQPDRFHAVMIETVLPET